MAKIPAKAIEEYHRILQKDPNSKIFAPLAEALRESGDFPQAETVAANGIRRHPEYVGGYVALGRLLLDQGRFREALPILQKACELDAENLLALHLLGTLYLQTSQPKEALKAFKRVLFLNPQSEKARNAVQKLESLSADEYEEDLFEYSGPKNKAEKAPQAKENPTPAAPALSANELERKLSFVDALIVRNNLEKARSALMELNAKTPGHPEINKRFELLEEHSPEEEAMPLQPLLSREKVVFDRKKRLLENLLQRIKDHNEGLITDFSNG
ncbi:MAG: tetratricopeptide repeat protein [Pseudobdellovibrionaceae bacterium]